MKLATATALARPLARLQEWLLPEPTLLVQKLCRDLSRYPERFEVTGSVANPSRLYIGLRQSLQGHSFGRATALEGGRICLQRDAITLEMHGQAPAELHWRDRAKLQNAVKAWLLLP